MAPPVPTWADAARLPIARNKHELRDQLEFDKALEAAQVGEKDVMSKNINKAATVALRLRSTQGIRHIVNRLLEVSGDDTKRRETAVYTVDSIMRHATHASDAAFEGRFSRHIEAHLPNIFKRALRKESTRKSLAVKFMERLIKNWKQKEWFEDQLPDTERIILDSIPDLRAKYEEPEMDDLDFEDGPDDVGGVDVPGPGMPPQSTSMQAMMAAMPKAGAPGTPAQPFWITGGMKPGNLAHKQEGDDSLPGTPEAPSTLRGAPHVLAQVPMTPVAAQGVPMTPFLPATPGGSACPATPFGACPGTPAMPKAEPMPYTPVPKAGAMPFTPGFAPQPFTPGVSRGQPFTPGGVQPFTPAPGGGAQPFTPGVGAQPFTPGTLPGSAQPFTPAPGVQPFTPGNLPGSTGSSAPNTPGVSRSAQPFTPLPGGVQPQPFTPSPGGGNQPFTPLPGGAAQPYTPSPGACGNQPQTPGIRHAPATPGIHGAAACGTPAWVPVAGGHAMPMTPGLPGVGGAGAPGTPGVIGMPGTPGFMPVPGGHAAPQTPGLFGAGGRGAPGTPAAMTPGFVPVAGGNAAPMTPGVLPQPSASGPGSAGSGDMPGAADVDTPVPRTSGEETPMALIKPPTVPAVPSQPPAQDVPTTLTEEAFTAKRPAEEEARAQEVKRLKTDAGVGDDTPIVSSAGAAASTAGDRQPPPAVFGAETPLALLRAGSAGAPSAGEQPITPLGASAAAGAETPYVPPTAPTVPTFTTGAKAAAGDETPFVPSGAKAAAGDETPTAPTEPYGGETPHVGTVPTVPLGGATPLVAATPAPLGGMTPLVEGEETPLPGARAPMLPVVGGSSQLSQSQSQLEMGGDVKGADVK